MKLNELKPKAGSKKKKLIVGRGIGSGKGKTSGSGQKGQKSRSGVAIKGFEGGQMPLYQRLPKIGFRNTAFTTNMAELTLGRLQAAIESKKIDPKKPIDEAVLVESGVVRRKKDGIKLLATGTIKDKVDLKVTKASKGAIAAVEKAGGKVEQVATEKASLEKGVKTSKKEKGAKRPVKKPASKGKK